MGQIFTAPPTAHLPEGAAVIPYGQQDSQYQNDICEHYIGTVECQNEIRKAHIKILRKKALANELIAATLGRALGLPIPDFFLLEITPEDHDYFSRSNLIAKQTEPRNSSAFALATIEPQTEWSKFIGLGWKRLNNWVQGDNCDLGFLMHTLLFDEWVFNTDRKPDNFLIDSKNKVWPIDHESCFTGNRWNLDDLKTHQKRLNDQNELAQELRDCIKGIKLCTQAATSIDPFICQAAKLPLSAIILANSGNNRLSSEERAALKLFLERRLGILEALICQHLNWPHQKRMAL